MMGRLVILIALVSSVSAFGQVLSSSISSDTILIGEPIEIKFKLKCNKNDSIINLNVDDLKMKVGSLDGELSQYSSELELLGKIKDSTYFESNTKYWEVSYQATSYDSGLVVINNRVVVINDSTYVFPDLELNVFLVEPIDSLDLYDINESFADVPWDAFSILNFLKKYWWIVAIILSVGLYFYLKRRNKINFTTPEKRTSLRDRTIRAIEALEEARLWEKDQLKEHFVELSFILRSYLASRYSIDLLERTTMQSKIILKEKGLNDDTIDAIIRILNQSDLVKFAKSQPNIKDILATTVLARQIIAETSPLDFEQIDD